MTTNGRTHDVASVLGVGMTRFAKHSGRSQVDLAHEALLKAVDDSGVSCGEIDAVYCGTALGGMLMGQRIVRDLGLSGIPVYNLENACSSSATALHDACLGIAAEEYNLVAVIGVEQLSRFGSGALPLVEEDHEVQLGMTMPALYAMRAQRYVYEHDATVEDLAGVVVKNRGNGALNPDAHFQKQTDVESVLRSRAVAAPLTLLQCCISNDGAAAAIVASRSAAARKKTRRGIRILSSTLTSGRFENGFRDMTRPEITIRCAQKAYELAGVGPEDLDVLEVHDAFSIAELLYYEAFGLCGEGEAAALLASGATGVAGRIPVNPSGGLLARGHPIGATGVAQVVEIVRQLRGEAGARQVTGAKVGATHCTGGGIAGYDHGACTIHIFAH